jgi:hypothetical protein
MKLLSTIIVFCLSLTAFGQRAPDGSPTLPFEKQKAIWLNNIEHQEFHSFDLMPENFKKDFLHYDFSTLFIPRNDFIGYIGTDYQRIRVYFTTVSKSSFDSSLYEIKGTSIVKNNKCDFKGTVRITSIRKYYKVQDGIDYMFANAGFKSEGILIGDYELKEDSTQKHSGAFAGIMMLFWYVDKYDMLHFDDIEMHVSDGYCNNLHCGTWTAYGESTVKVCNWGMYRIPFSGELDRGAAEFSPDTIYYRKGWEDFKHE